MFDLRLEVADVAEGPDVLPGFSESPKSPLIKEYTVNHNIYRAPIYFRYIPYLRGIALSGLRVKELWGLGL